MSKTRIIRYALAVLLILPLISFAGTQKMKTHKVIKGDTLWDISGKELHDPFLWPRIWKVNKWIMNPDLIYPGQKIRIPVYLIQKEKSGEKVAPAPPAAPPEPVAEYEEPVKEEVKVTVKEVKKYPLINRNILMASGYITDKIPGIGKIDGSPAGNTVHGNNDLVYVYLNRPAAVGDRFYVMSVSDPVEHPITEKKIGYVVAIAGEAEVVKVQKNETIAKIMKCYGEIEEGYILEPYYEIQTPLTTGQFRHPDMNGMIIATGAQITYRTMMEIVYIDKGCKDGVEVGDLFRTYAVEDRAVPNGVIQVISCRDRTATAVILESSDPIAAGNIFAKLQKSSSK